MKALVAKRIQPTAMLYVTALMRRIFYFQLPKRSNAVNASEVNILLRVSKLSCAARSAKVPEETTLYYDAPRPEYTGLSQWRRPIQCFFSGCCPTTPPPAHHFFQASKGLGRTDLETPLPTSRGYATVSVLLSVLYLKKTCHYPHLLSHVLS